MTLKEFNEINWCRGNVAKLKNGKEYLVKGTKGRGKYLLLFSQEYEKCFVADYHIVESRTCDYEEPAEVYQELKRKRLEEAEAKRMAERQAYLQAKEERKQKNLLEQERIRQEALARKAARLLNQQKQQKTETKVQIQPAPAVTAKPAEKPKSVEQPKPIVKPKSIAKAESVVVSTTPAVVEPAVGQVPRKRQRIRISRAEKVQIK